MNKRYIPLLITLLFLGLITGNAYAQRSQQVKSITIESVVKDDQGTSIPNAIISGKEGAVEAISDANGQFSIEVPENTNLLIEAKGFENKIISTALATQVVVMTKAPFLMDQSSTVNIPFAQIKKRDIVNSITVINAEEIVKYDNTQSIYDFLIGRVPGMLGVNNIRGIGGAVFIIDGIPRDPSFLNIEEVEQITILKDVNAAMLYGTQARNGLILITTKRGQAYKRKLNFTVEQGMSKPVALPKYLNSADYMKMYNEGLVNDGLPKKYDSTLITKYATGVEAFGTFRKNPYRYPDNDYYSSQYLKDSKPFTKFLTEFSGGNEVTQYYANASWVHSGTLYAMGDYGSKSSSDRFNVRANVNLRISDNIEAYIDAVGVFSIQDNPRGNFWNTAATEHPDYYANLIPLDLIKTNATMSGGADLNQAKIINGKYILGGTTSFTDNVWGNMNYAGYDQTLGRTATFNNGVEFDLKNMVEGLKLKTYLSFDIYNTYHQILANTYAVYSPVWEEDYLIGTVNRITQINKDVNTGIQTLPATGMSYTRMIGANALLDYERTFNESHNITGTLLAYHDRLRISDLFADEKHSHIGLRIAYNYERKYFIDFNSAYVNGFRLPEGNKGAFSPSIGLAMVLIENAGSSAVNYLKLKASGGILNTEFITTDYKLYESTYGGSGSSFSWNDGGRSNGAVISTRAANPNLTFEKMKNINIGIEGYFFDKLLYADANFFTTKNSGQLVQRTTFPAYLYLNVPYENFNETSYTGAELGIILSKTVGDLSIDLGANFLYASSKATIRSELHANDYQYRQGLPNDAIFGLEAIGFFADSADILASPPQWFGEVRKGDVKYKDQNGDGKIDQDDAVEIGNSIPNISYGLTLNLRYKNITLFALGNGQNGSETYYNGTYFRPAGDSKYSEEVLNRWTPETASTATYPRLSSKTSSNNNQNSTLWLYNNNYFRLDHVQLTVDLPSDFAKKISSKGIDIYLRGDNLIRFSEDAEKRQLVIGGEPNYRSYAIGVKLMF